MLQRILPRTTFECNLPEGWYLSRSYKGNRILYYNDVKVTRLLDSFDIEDQVNQVIANPPECIQSALYCEGKIEAESLSESIQKKLIRKGIISYEFAVNKLTNLASWLESHFPNTAEYAGNTYTKKGSRWYSEDGTCINASTMFFSIWDARVRYAKGLCSIEQVAEYSWSAVLECLGDDHQRFIDNVIKPKLDSNRKAWVWEAKKKRDRKLDCNSLWKHMEWDEESEIEEEYTKDVKSCLYEHFFTSVDNQVLMFTQPCNVPAFKGMHLRIRKYEDSLVSRLQSILPRLSRFRWNSLLGSYEPVFAPKAMSAEKRFEFFNLVHQVVIGEISGHEASLRLVNGDWKKIIRESRRYEKHMTQYVPFYAERWKKVDKVNASFSDVVTYIKNSITDLISLGYRSAKKLITSFNYDGCRFTLDAGSGFIKYSGPAFGNYLPDSWIKLKPEQRRKLLGDDHEWEYQEKAIRRYRRLFSFLNNVVHKHWDKASFFLQDKTVAKKKYLRPSSRFLSELEKRADNYLKSIERGFVNC